MSLHGAVVTLRSVTQRKLTAGLTRAQIRSIFNTRKFDDRTTCPDCGYKHRIWKISSKLWQCKRCGKKFGLLTSIKFNRISFDIQDIYELLFWFELELTDHKIAKKLDLNYRKLHRFYMKVRERLSEYEEEAIEVLDGEVKVDETYFGADFTNRWKKKREKLRKEGVVKGVEEKKGFKKQSLGSTNERTG